jgi:Fe-S oxidoreductase
MLERAPVLLGTPGGVVPPHPPPQETVLEAVGGEAALWSCTMCGACVEACPVAINQVDLIVGVRRRQVLGKFFIPSAPVAGPEPGTGLAPVRVADEGSAVPRGEGSVLVGGAERSRTRWMEGLGVRTLDGAESADVLLWVGCSGAFDERGSRVTRSLASVLQKAGVDFGVAGEREDCSGHAARRLGDESMFQGMAARNIETLGAMSFKTIVTNCPGCFNTLKNEYPQLGGVFDVRHATEFVAGLIDEGRIVFSGGTGPVMAGSGGAIGKVAYHDACSLGRYNGVYEAPRRIVRAIPGLELVELATNRDRAVCCGGGGQAAVERESGDVSMLPTRQFLETGANVLAVSGTDCLLALEEGLGAAGSPEGRSVSDLVELLDRATG